MKVPAAIRDAMTPIVRATATAPDHAAIAGMLYAVEPCSDCPLYLHVDVTLDGRVRGDGIGFLDPRYFAPVNKHARHLFALANAHRAPRPQTRPSSVTPGDGRASTSTRRG